MKYLKAMIIVLNLLGLCFGEKCKVLTFGGGGDRGAFSVGALKALAELPEEERNYDVVVGVSVGSINAFLVSLYSKGKEAEAAAELESLWLTRIQGRQSIWEHWTIPIVEGFFKSSFLNTSPLRKLLMGVKPSRSLNRPFFVGITNLKTGKYESIEMTNEMSDEDAIEVVMASSAVPVLFNNIYLGKNLYFDGTTIHGIDFTSGINFCKQKGFKEKDIVMDVIGLEDHYYSPNKANRNIFTMIARLVSLTYIKGPKDRYERIQHEYPEVKFRYIFNPLTPLPNSLIPLWFEPEVIRNNIQQGYEDGKKIIDLKKNNR